MGVVQGEAEDRKEGPASALETGEVSKEGRRSEGVFPAPVTCLVHPLVRYLQLSLSFV